MQHTALNAGQTSMTERPPLIKMAQSEWRAEKLEEDEEEQTLDENIDEEDDDLENSEDVDY